MDKTTLLSFTCLLFVFFLVSTACTKTPVRDFSFAQASSQPTVSPTDPPPVSSAVPSSEPQDVKPTPLPTDPPPASSAVPSSEPEDVKPTEDPEPVHPNPLTDKTEVANWLQENFTHYFQKYNLSCEAAVIRLTCGIWGIDDLDEDDILKLMPKHPSDPDLGLVMKNIDGGVFLSDGSIDWGNYGAHAPVVKKILETILKSRKLDSLYYIQQIHLDNKQLIAFMQREPACLGAIIWVARYINKKKPPVNEIGQVLGEHVEYVSPVLDNKGRMVVYDVWPWENQPFHMLVPYNRDLFDYITLLIMKKN